MQNEKNIHDALRAVLEKLIEVAPTAEQEWPELVRRAKDALASGDIDPAWAGVCAACAEGTPPERCAYYGEPNGCNAPKIGQHPTVREELNKAANICLFVKENCGDAQTARYMAEAIVAINEAVASLRAPGDAAAMRAALERSTRRLQGVVRELPLEMQKYVNADIRDNDAALAAPARNCDVGTADGLHAAFVRHCDACNPPGGCCHRKDTRGMLDTGCASILKCFARFAIANKDGDKK